MNPTPNPSRFPDRISGLIYLDAATDSALDDPEHPLLTNELNEIKKRIDEIEAGGVDEKKSCPNLKLPAWGSFLCGSIGLVLTNAAALLSNLLRERPVMHLRRSQHRRPASSQLLKLSDPAS